MSTQEPNLSYILSVVGISGSVILNS